MDWVAAKSYYIAYSSIDPSDSIIFFYNYFCTGAVAIISSLILPILYLFAPKSLQTNRTSHLFLISLICLSNMLFNFIQPFMLRSSGEPNLPSHTCRFVVYISTFAKPFGLYLTLLFSIERIFTKILSNFISRTTKQRLLVKRFYLTLIFITICYILSNRLYKIIQFIKIEQSIINNKNNSRLTVININTNQTDRLLVFQYCYRSIDIQTYGKILSFYTIQYWYEYFVLTIIGLSLSSILIYQYGLPRFQQRLPSRLSVNTKLYLSLSSCVILFELILLFLHSIVVNMDYNNSDTQVNYLETMLFVYNFRCIVLPFIICLTICNPLKECIYDIFIQQPYLDKINENDQINPLINRSETFAKTTNNDQFDL